MPRLSSLKSWQLLICVALIGVLCVLAGRAERLPIKTYTVADGLLRDFVFKIRQDSRGFLWFCTVEGVSRFDGYAFTNFTTADGLPDRHVNDFLETSDGAILIATDDGIARLNPTGAPRSKIHNPQFTIQNQIDSLLTVFRPGNPKAKNIRVLFEDRAGRIWAGTSDGLYRLEKKDDQIEFHAITLGNSLTPDKQLFLNAITSDEKGNLWIGTRRSGLFRLSPEGRAEHFVEKNGLPNLSVASLLTDQAGRVWVGSYEQYGLSLLKTEPDANGIVVERVFTVKDGLPSNWITSLLEASDGQMWVGTTAGLCKWQAAVKSESVCQVYKSENDLCDREIWSISEDKDNNLWFGTTCGTKRLARYGFTSFIQSNGLNFISVNSIFENARNEFFVSSTENRRGIARLRGNNFSVIKPRLPAEVTEVGWGWQQTVWQDRENAWWIPTANGLFRAPATQFEDLADTQFEKIETGAVAPEIFRIFEDSRGDIWIATIGSTSELLRWERDRNIWHNHSAAAGFTGNQIGTAFAEDANGNLWIATGSDFNDNSLIRYRDGQFRIFTQSEGAPPGYTKHLYLDQQNRLWLASFQDGLLRLDDTAADKLEFVGYTTADGLTSNSIFSVTEDVFGRIYAGTGRGIDRLNPNTGEIKHFTTADGLPSSFVETAYRDHQDVLWFGTEKGLVRFVPEPDRARQPPTILINGLRVAGAAQKVSILGETELSPLDLGYDERQITVDFLGLGATLGENLRYEYRLNTQADWTPTTERTVNFANLAPGAYRFEVRAQTADRIYSRTPATVSFRIAAPLWQNPWFVAALIVLPGLAIYAFYRYRLNRLLEIERTRMRIATDLHDDIGANLSKIALLSDIVRLRGANVADEDKKLLTIIAEASRASVDAMRDIVWAINPQRDSVAEMISKMRQHAEEVFIPNEIRVEFHASDNSRRTKLSLDARRELFLIFKEAVNNAARHSNCQKVEIKFEVAAGEIFLDITDDGHGFDATQISIGGHGLANMQNRVAKIGGRLKIASAPANGTSIKIRTPQK